MLGRLDADYRAGGTVRPGESLRRRRFDFAKIWKGMRMERRRQLGCFMGALAGVIASPAVPSMAQPERSIISVTSKDGTPIAVECAGAGPSLVIVHGGTGDRARWTPLFPLLISRFTVCAMDRRGHGSSGDSTDYTLQKEAEDVAAVVNAQWGPVFLMGHSYGGVAVLEAAFLTDRISKLVLYEPPLQERNHEAVASKMEHMIRAGSTSRPWSPSCTRS